MNLKTLAKRDWLSRWAGSYTFISSSYWSRQYYISLKNQLGINFNHTLFIHKRGTVAFYIPYDEFSKLGKYLAKKSEANISYVKIHCKDIKRNADKLTNIMDKLNNSVPSLSDYKQFLKYFDKHLALHVYIKKTVDFLTPKSLTKLMPYFRDARLYTENIYSDSEKFFRSIANAIAKQTNYNATYLTCLTQDDLELYIKSKILPEKNILKNRYNFSVIYSENKQTKIITGQKAKNIEKSIFKTIKGNKQRELKGICAYQGEVKGTARIILDPHNFKLCNKGDILITGMTRPEFLPLVKKVAAIVTDVGGLLSHAAITAREFKIPTIVGTGTATKTFKDGEKVIVDANSGIIKLINN
ncbi:MAG: PEP-utilizing enzyme [Patescibacteria group bacterium]